MKTLATDFDHAAPIASAVLPEQFLAVRGHGRIDFVAVDDLLYVEGSEKYAELVLTNGQRQRWPFLFILDRSAGLRLAAATPLNSVSEFQ